MSQTNPKDNSRKKGTAEERRRQRQEEAEHRKRKAAKRTPDEQLRVLRERGVTSGKEYDRLVKQINEGKGKAKGKPDKMKVRLP